MLRAVFVARVELDLHAHTIPDSGRGCSANVTVQVEIEASVTYGHHVDVPGICGLAIDANENRKRLAPGRLDGVSTGCADEDERVDASDFYDCWKGGGRHGNLR